MIHVCQFCAGMNEGNDAMNNPTLTACLLASTGVVAADTVADRLPSIPRENLFGNPAKTGGPPSRGPNVTC